MIVGKRVIVRARGGSVYLQDPDSGPTCAAIRLM
jgi:hypothetical protein